MSSSTISKESAPKEHVETQILGRAVCFLKLL